MSFEGMDVDQLQGLAKQVDADAQKLYSLVQSLNGVIGGLTFLWNGPVAATFEQNWQSKNRPALLAAHNTLTSLHAHLVANINQQISASAAEGGWTAERIVGDAENVLTVLGLVGMAAPFIPQAGKLLDDTPVGTVLDGVGVIGDGVGVYHVADDAYHVQQDLSKGQYGKAASDFTEGVGDGLQEAGGKVAEEDPLLGVAIYGAGVDVKLADDIANLDWKDTPNPLSGSNFSQYYVPEFQSMGTGAYWEQAGKTLFGAM